jgi:hypothetical protein
MNIEKPSLLSGFALLFLSSGAGVLAYALIFGLKLRFHYDYSPYYWASPLFYPALALHLPLLLGGSVLFYSALSHVDNQGSSVTRRSEGMLVLSLCVMPCLWTFGAGPEGDPAIYMYAPLYIMGYSDSIPFMFSMSYLLFRVPGHPVIYDLLAVLPVVFLVTLSVMLSVLYRYRADSSRKKLLNVTLVSVAAIWMFLVGLSFASILVGNIGELPLLLPVPHMLFAGLYLKRAWKDYVPRQILERERKDGEKESNPWEKNQPPRDNEEILEVRLAKIRAQSGLEEKVRRESG